MKKLEEKQWKEGLRRRNKNLRISSGIKVNIFYSKFNYEEVSDIDVLLVS